jgi:hypothetical protein
LVAHCVESCLVLCGFGHLGGGGVSGADLICILLLLLH